MLMWAIAFAITIAVCKRGRIETRPLKLAFGSLVLTTAVGFISLPIVLLTAGAPAIVNDPWNLWSTIITLLIIGWFLAVKSRLALVFVCLMQVFGGIGNAVYLSDPTFPASLALGTGFSCIVNAVGAVACVYCFFTWKTSVPNQVEVLNA